MKTGSITVIILSCLLEIANAAKLEVTEIRFKSITGYSHDQFTLKIRSNGTVEYVGQNFVDVTGRQTSRISQADFSRLVRKIEHIRFFQLDDRYDRYPLDKPSKQIGNEATAERTIVTDQPTEIVSVTAGNHTKTVEDCMGAPKGLYELEELILDVTRVSRWTGGSDDLRDVPYYDSFPMNRPVTYRALLEHFHTEGDRKKISGYLLMFMKNKAIQFDIDATRNIDLGKFDGYIVDASGYIKEKPNIGHKFVLKAFRPVRRYIPLKALQH